MKLAFFETFMTSTFFEGLHSSLWNQPLVSTKTLQESGNKWAKMWNFKLNASLIHVLQDLEESISKHPRRLAKIVSLLTKIREKTNYINKKTLWPLFIDGVQLPRGCSHFEQAVYILPFSSQKFLVLILSTL